MRSLPLYEALLPAPVETAQPLLRDPKCRRCELHNGCRNVCLPADGDAGGVLFVGEAPGHSEDTVGRPFVGEAGKYLRGLVSAMWAGPVAYDNALRCASGTAKRVELQRSADACRGYLARTMVEVKPTRVVALGGLAVYSLLGRALPMGSVRRGYGWLTGASPNIPVFYAHNPAAVSRNRFARADFERDLEWALTASVPASHFSGVARVVSDERDAKFAVADLRTAEWVAFDTETAGIMFEPDFKMLSVSFAGKGSDDAWVWDGAALRDPDARTALVELLTSVPLVAHNIKFDFEAVSCALGVDLRAMNLRGCTMLWRSLLDSDALSRLEYSAELVGMGGHKQEAQDALELGVKAAKLVVSRRAASQVQFGFEADATVDPVVERGVCEGWDDRAYGFATLPNNVLVRYNARDTVSDAYLAEQLDARLAAEPDLQRIWNTVVRPLTPAVAQIEKWGIAADKRAIESFALWLDARQRDVLARLSPYEIDANSNQQVATLLYKKLGLQCPHETKGGSPSTDDDALEALRGQHPVVEHLRAHRRLTKMRGTYADGGGRKTPDQPFELGQAGLIRWVRSDGRFHPHIKLNGTETGRPSCEQPNLMNIPRAETEEGKFARDCFVASPGYVLMEFDQSQVELRVAADLSGDQKMLAIFHSGQDYHYRTAQLIAPLVWKMRPEDVPTDGKERTAAKTVNFSLVYKKGDAGLAEALGCSVDQARTVREAILGEFRTFAAWSDAQVRIARQTGAVWTWWNGHPARRRWMHGIADPDDARRTHAERAAVNSPVQGTASEYTLAGLIETVKWIQDEDIPARLVLTVYDSILLEVRRDAQEEVAYVVPKLMTSWPTKSGVPLKADLKVGASWGSLTKKKNS